MSVFWFPDPPPILPTLNGFSVHKKPMFASGVQTTVSGIENTIAKQAFPLWEYELTYEVLREQTQNQTLDPQQIPFTELEQISAVFLATRGQYGRFYYDDISDDSRLGQLVGIGDGTTVDFPFVRTWGSSFIEPVGGVNQDLDINVYFDGVLQSFSIYSVSDDNTTLHFLLTPPDVGVVITADFSFFYLCRFIEDIQDYDQFMHNLTMIKSFKFRSVKEGLLSISAMASLIFQTQPQQGVCEDLVPFNVVASVPFSTATVTVSIATNPSGATLGGTVAKVISAGVVTFDDLTIDQPAFGYTLQVDATGLTSAVSNPFDMVAATDAACTPNFSRSSLSNLPVTAGAGLFYVWYYMANNGPPENYGNVVFGSAAPATQGGFFVEQTGGGVEFAFTANGSGFGYGSIMADTPNTIGVGWHQDVISWGELSSVATYQFMRDGILLTPTVLSGVPNLIGSLNAGPYKFGWTQANAVSDMFLAIVVQDANSLFDLTNPTNVAKIFNAGSPVDISGDPSTVLGTAPQIFFHNDYTTYSTNLGNGGAITDTNEFTSKTPW